MQDVLYGEFIFFTSRSSNFPFTEPMMLSSKTYLMYMTKGVIEKGPS